MKAEFSRRRRINSRYSMRAFAKSIGMDHSTLSQILRGKRPLTRKAMRSLATKMRWKGSAVLRAAQGLPEFHSKQIALELGLSVDEVNIALTDLCLLGVLRLGGE